MLVDGHHGSLFESVRVRRAQRRPWRAPAWPWSLIFPEVLEAARREFRVSHGVRDVPMPKVRLQGPGVRPLVGESVAGRGTEHMRMRLDLKAGRLPGPLDHPPEAGHAEGRPALAHKHKRVF